MFAELNFGKIGLSREISKIVCFFLLLAKDVKILQIVIFDRSALIFDKDAILDGLVAQKTARLVQRIQYKTLWTMCQFLEVLKPLHSDTYYSTKNYRNSQSSRNEIVCLRFPFSAMKLCRPFNFKFWNFLSIFSLKKRWKYAKFDADSISYVHWSRSESIDQNLSTFSDKNRINSVHKWFLILAKIWRSWLTRTLPWSDTINKFVQSSKPISAKPLKDNKHTRIWKTLDMMSVSWAQKLAKNNYCSKVWMGWRILNRTNL